MSPLTSFTGGDVALVYLFQFRENAILTAMFVLKFSQACGDIFKSDRELIEGFLLLAKILRNNEVLGNERSHVQPVSLSLPFLSFTMMRVVSAFQPSAKIM